MADPVPPPAKAHLIDSAYRAEIVDRLYEVAVDPIRLEDLMKVWEVAHAPLRTGPVEDAIELDDAEIEAHLRRATVFLDRFEATRGEAVYRSVLEDIPRSAAFLSDGSAAIAAFNRPASIAFGLRDGAQLADLPFDAQDISLLRGVIYKVASGHAERVVTLRIRSSTTGSPVIVRIGPIASDNAKPLALVMSTELVWPEGFEVTVQEAFGLTVAEVEIVQGMTLGQPIKDIAEARGAVCRNGAHPSAVCPCENRNPQSGRIDPGGVGADGCGVHAVRKCRTGAEPRGRFGAVVISVNHRAGWAAVGVD